MLHALILTAAAFGYVFVLIGLGKVMHMMGDD